MPAWIAEFLLVFAVFAYAGAWPVPDVNEPHYLARCRHHWDPAWCEHDFFLNSADSHAFFFAAFGWITRLMTLPTAAWLGRICTWMLLAVGWLRLSRAVVPRFGWAVLSAALLAALSERFHESGEWIIGGFESKGLAYAAVFSALADAITGRWNRVWLSMGAASALHVLVGGWSTAALGFAWLTMQPSLAAGRAMLPGLIGGAMLASIGLLPALALNAHASSDVTAEAARLYVFMRLPHHLWPLSFKPVFVERFALLSCVWVVLAAFVNDAGRTTLVRRFVLAALLIAGTGWAIALIGADQPTWAAKVMRYYWFRLADAAVPLGVALSGCSALAGAMETHRRWSRPARFISIVIVVAHFVCLTRDRIVSPVPRADSPGKVLNLADWREACSWINTHTPPDALFLTPRSSLTFKWYAERGEVVTWKDVPQDAVALVVWWQRMHEVHGTGAPPGEKPFYDSLAETSEAHLLRMSRKYRAQFLLTTVEPALALPLLHQNNTYAVYELEAAGHAP
jgi:hypothetical protein